MERNVYSLVLLDELVEEVDKLAYKRHTSRSSLINQILAEYLSFSTPESRIKDVFSDMEKLFSDLEGFRFRDQPSDTMISVCSALHYRYRPTVRYVLELYRRSEPYMGELRISVRTQNEDLLRLTYAYFQLWNKIENQWIGQYFPNGIVPCEILPGRCTRRLRLPKRKESEFPQKIAQAILDYICEFDAGMKTYFTELENPGEAERRLECSYREHLKHAAIL